MSFLRSSCIFAKKKKKTRWKDQVHFVTLTWAYEEMRNFTLKSNDWLFPMNIGFIQTEEARDQISGLFLIVLHGHAKA